MMLEPALRLLAGVVVLVSVALAQWVDARFVWLTVFVGINLLQSAFTNWCPAMAVLRRLGLRESRGVTG